MESLHLTGPPPAIRRLAQLAAGMDVTFEVEGGVLRVPFDESGPLIDSAQTVLAPLEAGLVKAIRVDLSSGSMLSLLTVACASPSIANLAARRKHRRLLHAIHAREGITIGYQPVVELATSRPIGFEALLRVRVGTADVSPAEVLSAAEDCGRLVEVDAVARSVAVHEAAAALGNRTLFVNLLPASLPVPEEQLLPFARDVDEVGLERGQIVLEAPVGPAGVLRRQLEAVFAATREAGLLVGLDNVRSQRDLDAVDVLPDYVKLDRSMVRSVMSSSGARSIGAVVRDCMHSGAVVVAQGVESPEQLQAVKDLGVLFAQGWELGRPGAMPSEVDATTA
jgi:EAL domain-containing protein (putative c-di-GMP-specific phosphodiesterase class I)